MPNSIPEIARLLRVHRDTIDRMHRDGYSTREIAQQIDSSPVVNKALVLAIPVYLDNRGAFPPEVRRG